MTKRAMLRKWPTLGSIEEISGAINWIERSTTLSDNPFLFVWDRGDAVWGFRSNFSEVAHNLSWNLRYMLTRMRTTERVLDHAINSPVVAMTPKEKLAAKSAQAQVGGTVAFLESIIKVLG